MDCVYFMVSIEDISGECFINMIFKNFLFKLFDTLFLIAFFLDIVIQMVV